MNFEKLVNEIVDKSGLSKEEILDKINKKIIELSGLVTKEGAALLVGKELGLDIIRKPSLKIKDIEIGMKGFNIEGRIFKITDIVNFEREDGVKGRVSNLYIADETGFVRIPLWNDQVDLIDKLQLKVGDTIQIVNGIARENVFGWLEIVLGKFGRIRKIENDGLPSIEKIMSQIYTNKPKRVKIKDLERGYYEIRGTIVHVFDSNFIFQVCPVCQTTIKNSYCEEHGEVDPDKFLVVSTIIDDGSGNIRAVFFRDVAEKLLGISADDLEKNNIKETKSIIDSRLLGKELVLRGRVKENKIFKRLEFIVNEVEELNVLNETKKILEELKNG